MDEKTKGLSPLYSDELLSQRAEMYKVLAQLYFRPFPPSRSMLCPSKTGNRLPKMVLRQRMLATTYIAHCDA